MKILLAKKEWLVEFPQEEKPSYIHLLLIRTAGTLDFDIFSFDFNYKN